MPVLETDSLFALVDPGDHLHADVVAVFRRVSSGDLENYRVAASAFLEYDVGQRSKKVPSDAVKRILRDFRAIPNLGEVPLTGTIVEGAHDLRRDYDLTYFDSIHVATALAFDGIIVGSDKAFARVKNLKCVHPRDV